MKINKMCVHGSPRILNEKRKMRNEKVDIEKKHKGNKIQEKHP